MVIIEHFLALLPKDKQGHELWFARVKFVVLSPNQNIS